VTESPEDGICSPGETCSGSRADCCGEGGTPRDPERVDHTRVFSDNPDFSPKDTGFARALAKEQFDTPAEGQPRPGEPGATSGQGYTIGSGFAAGEHRKRHNPGRVFNHAQQTGGDLGSAPPPPPRPLQELPREQGDSLPRGPAGSDDDQGWRDAKENEDSDPVHPGTGELRVERVDLRLAGIGIPFELTRVYRSRWSYDGPLGFGWTHAYDQRLVDENLPPCEDLRITWLTGDGGTVVFTMDGGRWSPSPVVPYRLQTEAGGTWKLTHPDGLVSRFDTNGDLASLTDLNGNQLVFTWGVPPLTSRSPTPLRRLLSAVDTVGREVVFHYDPRGYVDWVEVAGLGLVVDYEVDERGDLKRVIGAGAVTGGGGEEYDYLEGFEEGADYVPTPQLDAFCAARCSRPAEACNGLSACAWAARQAVGECTDACFDPANCVKACDDCHNQCNYTPEAIACKAGPDGCESTCVSSCWDRGRQSCEDRNERSLSQLDDRRERGLSEDRHFLVRCAQECGELARDHCDRTLVCHRRAWQIETPTIGTGGDITGTGSIDVTSEGNCFGTARCDRAGWVRMKDRINMTPRDWGRETSPYSMECSTFSFPCQAGNFVAQLSTTCDTECFDCMLWGLNCPSGSAADGRLCASECTDRLYNECLTVLPASCEDQCRLSCDETCAGACTATCDITCQASCNDPSTCRALCEGDAIGYRETCAGSCLGSCRNTHGPKGGVAFGRPSDLNHNLFRVKTLYVDGASQRTTLLVENTYGEDVRSPDFDRVIRHRFGDGLTGYAHYDLSRLAAAPVSPEDEPYVEQAPASTVICPVNCPVRVAEPGGRLWVGITGGGYLVFPDIPRGGPFTGPVEMPKEMERYRWYRLSGTPSDLTLEPSVRVPDQGITIPTAQGAWRIVPKAAGGLQVHGLEAKRFGEVLAFDMTLVRGEEGWRAVPGRPALAAELKVPGVCDPEFWVGPARADGVSELFPEGACRGDTDVAPLGLAPGGEHKPGGALVRPGGLTRVRFSPGRAAALGFSPGADPCSRLDVAVADPVCQAAVSPIIEDPSGAGLRPECSRHWGIRSPMPRPGEEGPAVGLDCTWGETPVVGEGQCEPDDYAGAAAEPRGHDAQRLVSATVVRSSAGLIWTYYADPNGRIVRVVNQSAGARWERNYDAAGRLTGVMTPFGDRTCNLYSEEGDLLQSTRLPAPGRWAPQPRIDQAYRWFPNQRLDTVFDPADRSRPLVQFGWDARGNLTSVTHPGLNRTVTFVPDARGRTQERIGPDGTVTRYTFDPATGQPDSIAYNADGAPDEQHTVTLARDPLGRISRIEEPGRSTLEWDWSPDGRLLERRLHLDPASGDPPLVTTYVYDGGGGIRQILRPQLTETYTLEARGPTRVLEVTANDGSARARTQCVRYDGRGRLAETVDPEGRRTVIHRDVHGEIGRVVKGHWPLPPHLRPPGVWDEACAGNVPQGRAAHNETIVTYTRDTSGVLTSVEYGETNLQNPWTRTFDYDGYARRVEERLADGTRLWVGPDARDRPRWTAAHHPGTLPLPAGLVNGSPDPSDPTLAGLSLFEYDDLNRLTRRRALWFADDEQGNRTFLGAVGGWLEQRTAFRDALREVETTDVAGHSVLSRFDRIGRRTRIELPGGIAVEDQYTSHGRALDRTITPAVTPGGSHHLRFELTPFGTLERLIGDEAPGQPAINYRFDTLGRLEEVHTRIYGVAVTYDAHDQVRALWRLERDGRRSLLITHAYDRTGLPMETRDATGATWGWTYDALGRIEAETFPDSSRRTRQYRAGTLRPRRVDTRAGDVRSYSYDAFGLPRRIVAYRATAPSGWTETVVDYRRNVHGVVQAHSHNKVPDPTDDVVLDMRYDSLGSSIRIDSNLFPGQPVLLEREARGFPERITTALGQIEHQRDPLARMTSVHLDGALVAQLTNAGFGPPSAITYGNGLVEDLGWDTELRRLGMQVSLAGAPLIGQDVYWGADGSVARIDLRQGAGTPVSDLYLYDAFGRLERAGYDATVVAPMTSGALARSAIEAAMPQAREAEGFQLDPADRWRRVARPHGTLVPRYGVDHRLLDFGGPVTTDPDGYTLALPDGPGYGYDGFGRLVTAHDPASDTTIEFFNDAFGRLARWQDSRRREGSFQWGEDRILRERRGPDEPEILFVPGPWAGPIAVRRGPELHYNHYGWGDRLLAATDAIGALVERYRYTAYAEPQILDVAGTARSASAVGNRMLLSGQPFFPELGMHRLEQRWYRPDIGRFLRPDPLGLHDGPNAFNYAGANPTMFDDPLGLDRKKQDESLRESSLLPPVPTYAQVQLGPQYGPFRTEEELVDFEASFFPIIGTYREAKKLERAAIIAKEMYVNDQISYWEFAQAQAMHLLGIGLVTLDIWTVSKASLAILPVRVGAILEYEISQQLLQRIRNLQSQFKPRRGQILDHIAEQLGETRETLLKENSIFYHGTAGDPGDWAIREAGELYTSTDPAVARAFAERTAERGVRRTLQGEVRPHEQVSAIVIYKDDLAGIAKRTDRLITPGEVGGGSSPTQTVFTHGEEVRRKATVIHLPEELLTPPQ
jgi:RHS repeat-associated protein